MSSLDACIYAIIAILGVAYPILLQVISRLDDRYSSARAVRLFEQEISRQWFEGLLIGSVGAVVLWFLNWPAPACLVDAPGWVGNVGWLLAHSAIGLVYLTTLGLVVSFFLLTRKTITYYNTQKLVEYLQACYQKNRQHEQYFEVLVDVFLSVLATRSSPVLSDVTNFFSEQFKTWREPAEAATKPAAPAEPQPLEQETVGQAKVIYPAVFYQLTYRTTEELALLGNRKPQWVANLAAGGGWLLGDYQYHPLSEQTYSALWHNLRLALDYDQEEMVYEYWKTAYQYFEFGLSPIPRQYERDNFAPHIVNGPAIAFRENERTRFLELHHLLGALLLYTGRHKLLRRLWDYTNTNILSSRYLLLPGDMTEVIPLFVRYQNQYDRLMPLDVRYSFPNEIGVSTEGVITHWLLTYVAVLFLRQYTLHGDQFGKEPLAYPMLPEEQPALKSWRDTLPNFRSYVQQVLQDASLIRSLRLDDLPESQQQQTEPPLEFITTVEGQVAVAYRKGADELEMSQEKIQEFYTESGSLLEQTVEVVLGLAAPDGARAFSQARYLRVGGRLVSKDAFAAKSEVDHLSHSTALAVAAQQYLRLNIIRLFVSQQTTTYRVLPEEVFDALNKLELSEEHLIINLDVNLTHLAELKKVEGWQPGSYRGSTVQEFAGGGERNTLLIIKRQELPAIRLNAPDRTQIAKYRLRKISEPFNLYATVLDGNTLSPEVSAEVQRGDFKKADDGSIASQALEMLWLLLEFKWQQGAKLVRIVAPYRGDEEGKTDDLAIVAPF